MNVTINRARVVVLATIFSPALLWPSVAALQDTDDWYCEYLDDSRSGGPYSYYYSALFRDEGGSASEVANWEREFEEYLKRNYSVGRGLNLANCTKN